MPSVSRIPSNTSEVVGGTVLVLAYLVLAPSIVESQLDAPAYAINQLVLLGLLTICSALCLAYLSVLRVQQ
jgi:hypothetical protein